jgi:hypothetical protein
MAQTRSSLHLDKLLVLAAVSALCVYLFWWRPRVERAETCRLQTRNYQTAINSCGMDGGCYEAWKDPAATERLVEKLFATKIPRCPSGGTYSMVHGIGPHPSVPTILCSRPECQRDRDVVRETARSWIETIRLKFAP